MFSNTEKEDWNFANLINIFFKFFINNSRRENKGNHDVKEVWICNPNYHKIRLNFAFNLSNNYCFEQL